MTPPASAEARARMGGEDSDVIVALIRAAFIIAFLTLRFGYVPTRYRVPLHMDVVLTLATLFSLVLLMLYLRGKSLHLWRPLALLLDLLLVAGAIVTFRQAAELQGEWASQDLFGLYYLVVIAAAVWYRLPGAVSTAVAAIALAALSLHFFPSRDYSAWLLLHSANPPLLLLVAVISGYLMRARDAEHLAIVELRQEMRLARALQSRMLPSCLPTLRDYELGLIFSPARQVGGDFYDLRLLDHDHLLIVLADMSGKSVYGLVHLSLVYSHLQAAANQGHGPGRIARMVNSGTYEALQPESYAAVFIGILRLSDGLLNFVNCGHVPPVRVRRRGYTEPDLLTTGGTVIGAVRDPAYEERAVTLAPGDALVCFSDGVSDARNGRREQFGEQRVAELAQEALDLPAQNLAQHVLDETLKFAVRPGQDDVTIVIICRAG